MKNLIPLLLLLPFLLTGCGGEAGKTSSTLEVSRGFTMTNSSFGGGLVIVAENAAGKKISISLGSALSKTINLDNGSWNFYAFGWDGGANDYKFTGTPYCGLKKQVVLQGTPVAVDLTVTAADCTNAEFVADAAPRDVYITACGAFYNYSSPTNTFSTAPTNELYCMGLPNEYLNTFSHVKIQSVDVSAPGFASQCLNANSPGRLTIPTQKFPFDVKFYRSQADCLADNTRAATYNFKSGIVSGDPLSFDHHYATQAGSNAMLILPTSISRRGKSPFMSMIPRLLCGSSGSYQDCISEPDLSGGGYNAHINVGWTNSKYEQVVLKNAPVTDCTGGGVTLPTDAFFVASDCKVKDGKVMASIQRNELMCQSTPTFPGTSQIKDIHYKNGRIFILRYESSTPSDVLEVFASDGAKIATKVLGTSDNVEVAATNAGDIFLAGSSVIRRFSFNAATNIFTAQTPLTLASATKIDVTNDGAFLVAAVGSNVRTHNVATDTQVSTVSVTASDLQIVNSTVQILVYGGPGDIHDRALNLTTGTLAGTGNTIFTISYGQSFYFDGTNYYITENSTNLVKRDVTGAVLTTLASAGGKLTVMGTNVYKENSTSVAVYSTTGLTPVSNQSGTCSSSLVFQAGGISKTLLVKSTNTATAQPLFEDGLRLFGRRSFTDFDRPFYFFNSLSHDEEDSGGELSDVQNMLSPMGISGLFSDYSCTQLASSANPITKTLNVKDYWKNHFGTISVTASSYSDPLDPFVCNDTDSTGSCGGALYDLELTYRRIDLLGSEVGRILLKCGKKLGEFETLETETAKTSRYMLLWNTEADTAARFESYEMNDATEFSFGMVKLQKSDPVSLWSRTINYRAGLEFSGFVMDLHRDGTNLKSKAYHISQATRATFGSNTSNPPGYAISYDAIRTANSFSSATPVSCMSITNTNVTTVSGACTLNTYTETMTSKSIDMSIDIIMASDNPSDATIRPIFTLTP